MAEAVARHIASDVVLPASAGLSPLGRIAESTRRALLEKGITLEGQFSKGVNEAGLLELDLIVNMSGIPGKSLFASGNVEDWDVEDPYGEDLATHRRICDDIEARVQELAVRLRNEDATNGSR
jgi:arsenate reductase